MRQGFPLVLSNTSTSSFLFDSLYVSIASNRLEINKAGYTAQDAPSTRLKITGDGRTDGWTDTTTYRDATAHLKRSRLGIGLWDLLRLPFVCHLQNTRCLYASVSPCVLNILDLLTAKNDTNPLNEKWNLQTLFFFSSRFSCHLYQSGFMAMPLLPSSALLSISHVKATSHQLGNGMALSRKTPESSLLTETNIPTWMTTDSRFRKQEQSTLFPWNLCGFPTLARTPALVTNIRRQLSTF